ncbi:uncharacterized protein LOC135703559 [Ochlerotatus camptorhynchus]|uniref:uncharacterized protein LOC135703559 n=1 Tax=Ochlerotatus camptorhynchus TaxID=644619 RepID=UPI0031DFFFEA
MTGIIDLQTEIQSEYRFLEGECFDSYEEFHAKLETHSAKDLVYYWCRDSRTIEGAAYKTSRPIAAALRYYSVRYSCIFGGQKFEPKTGGSKRLRPSIRNDCPAFIALRASKCGQQLMVMSVSNIHNHEISAEMSKNLAHNKKLSSDIKQKVMELLIHNVNKKLIREYVRLTNGKELTTKDLCNLMASLRKNGHFAEASSDMKKTDYLTSELIKFISDHGGTIAIKSLERTPASVAPESTGGETDMFEERLMEDFEEVEQEVQSNCSFEDQKSDGSHEFVIEILNETPCEEESSLIPKTSTPKRRTRWRTPSCFACGSNNRLVRAQLQVLRARRDKIREETELLRLTKRKLRLEIQAMNKLHSNSSA